MQREYLFVIIAAIFYGTIAVGGQFFKNIGLSLYEISFYSLLPVALILLPFILIKRQYRIKKDLIMFFVVFGLIGALLRLTEFGGIMLGVPISIVVLLLYTQPIWTTIFGKLLLREKITSKKIVAIIIVLVGLIFLLEPWKVISRGKFMGYISALFGGLFLSLWIIWGRKSGINKQHWITTTFGYASFSVIWLLLFYPIITLFIENTQFTRFSYNFPLNYWLYFILYALIAGIIPHSFFYRALKKVQASIAGIILLLEPVSATLMAAIIFSQLITTNIILGGALILLSNYIIIHKTRSP